MGTGENSQSRYFRLFLILKVRTIVIFEVLFGRLIPWMLIRSSRDRGRTGRSRVFANQNFGYVPSVPRFIKALQATLPGYEVNSGMAIQRLRSFAQNVDQLRKPIPVIPGVPRTPITFGQ